MTIRIGLIAIEELLVFETDDDETGETSSIV